MGLTCSSSSTYLYMNLPAMHAQSSYTNLSDFSSIFVTIDESEDDTLIYSIEVSNYGNSSLTSEYETKMSITLFEFGSYTLDMILNDDNLCLSPDQMNKVNSLAADNLLKKIIHFIRHPGEYDYELELNILDIQEMVYDAMYCLGYK